MYNNKKRERRCVMKKNKIIGYKFCKYIMKNGKKIYPKNSKVFRFPIYKK